MKDYSLWMSSGRDNEEMVFEMCEKSYVKINQADFDFECIINDSNDWQKNVDKTILIRKDVYDIKYGDSVSFEDQSYLITVEREDRDFYWSGKMTRCNNSLTLMSEVRAIVDYDDVGKPIWDTQNIPVFFPSIVKSRNGLADSDIDSKINIPDGSLLIAIGYTDHEELKLDKELAMYNQTYKITHLDYTQVINNTGVIVVQADLVV
ncbi:hypothetical protein [Chengkuizengella marina]|uniref:Uncharacterized protein n=1 Tax=Chengkuizengella marina TaxID=2507566 RepID=A0A6N9PYK8_9BACL|nr:hypothetical protein [Chengkuizengella marina]NBI28601.1 hypothetical protein [Chengkuizengella marina]